MRALALLATTILAAPAFAAPTDDWAIRRAPRRPAATSSAEEALEAHPEDASAVSRLARGKASAALLERFREKTSYGGKVAYAALLLRVEGRSSDARAALRVAQGIDGQRFEGFSVLADVERREGHIGAALIAVEASLARVPRERRVAELEHAVSLAAEARDAGRAERWADEAARLGDAHVRERLVDVLAGAEIDGPALRLLEQVAAEARKGDRPDLLRRRGEIAERLGRLDVADQAYRAALGKLSSSDPQRRDIWERRLAVARQRDRLGQLLADLRGSDATPLHVRARLLDELGRTDEAADAYRGALRRDSAAVGARRRLIALLERAGRDGEALEERERLAKAAPGDARPTLEVIERMLQLGRTKEALARTQKLSRAFGRDAGALTAATQIYLRAGRLDEAAKVAERLVKLEPHEPDHLVTLGDIWQQRGDLQRARQSWLRICELCIPRGDTRPATKPGCARERALHRAAEVLLDREQSPEALAILDRALRLAPDDAAILRTLALAQERQRNVRGALATWDRIRTLASSDIGARGMLGEARARIVALEQRNYTLPSRIRSELTRMHGPPADLDAGWLAVEGLLKQHDLTGAEAALREIAQRWPDQADALAKLATLQRRGGRFDEAIATLEKLATSTPARARSARAEIAAIELERYRDERALDVLGRAAQEAPDDVETQLAVARLAEGRDDAAAASAALRNVIRADPQRFEAALRLARLLARGGPEAMSEALRIALDVLRRARDEDVLVDAVHLATDLGETRGRLGDVEREIAGFAAAGERAALRRAYVDLLRRVVATAAAAGRSGDASATADLTRLGQRALPPLLDLLASKDPVDREAAAVTLGDLGNRAALPALVRAATRVERPPPPPPEPTPPRPSRKPAKGNKPAKGSKVAKASRSKQGKKALAMLDLLGQMERGAIGVLGSKGPGGLGAIDRAGSADLFGRASTPSGSNRHRPRPPGASGAGSGGTGGVIGGVIGGSVGGLGLRGTGPGGGGSGASRPQPGATFAIVGPVQPATRPDTPAERQARRAALLAIGALGGPADLKPLLPLLERGQPERLATLWAISGSSAAAAADVLRQALASPESDAQSVACLSLGRRRDAAARAVLADPYRRSELRAFCAIGAGQARDRGALSALVRLVADPPPLGPAAVTALGSLARSPLPADERSAALGALAQLAVETPISSVRALALSALGAAPTDDAPREVAPIFSPYQLQTSSWLRALSIRRGPEARALPMGLAPYLTSGLGVALTRPALADRACRDLETLVPAAERDGLLRALAPQLAASPRPAAALPLLARVDPERARALLARGLGAGTPRDRQRVLLEAIPAMSRTIAPAPAVEQALADAAQSPSWLDRASAVRALASLSPRHPRLREAERDPNGLVRAAARAVPRPSW